MIIDDILGEGNPVDLPRMYNLEFAVINKVSFVHFLASLGSLSYL